VGLAVLVGMVRSRCRDDHVGHRGRAADVEAFAVPTRPSPTPQGLADRPRWPTSGPERLLPCQGDVVVVKAADQVARLGAVGHPVTFILAPSAPAPTTWAL